MMNFDVFDKNKRVKNGSFGGLFGVQFLSLILVFLIQRRFERGERKPYAVLKVTASNFCHKLFVIFYILMYKVLQQKQDQLIRKLQTTSIFNNILQNQSA